MPHRWLTCPGRGAVSRILLAAALAGCGGVTTGPESAEAVTIEDWDALLITATIGPVVNERDPWLEYRVPLEVYRTKTTHVDIVLKSGGRKIEHPRVRILGVSVGAVTFGNVRPDESTVALPLSSVPFDPARPETGLRLRLQCLETAPQSRLIVALETEFWVNGRQAWVGRTQKEITNGETFTIVKKK